jgi:anion-transporting  ArsA/GET3 family ATPase
MSARVVICCGSGGVGKTTVSAALALRFAKEGHRVAVLTIDPARRLADSLGIGELTNTARRVPLERVAPGAAGSVDAMMLDAKSTFDEMVRRWSPDEASAERVLGNRYYQAASARLGGSHEYMAMERLLQLWKDGPYDVVVLDTPPTRHALDFLQAPDRMAGLMDQGVLRWLILPSAKGGWRALEFGSEAVARILKRLIGRNVIGEIADFFDAFRNLSDRMRDRSFEVRQLLRDPHTRFVLVTSPAPTSRAEALYFLDVLKKEGMPFGGFLVNRTITSPIHSSEAVAADLTQLAERLSAAELSILQASLLQAHEHRTLQAADHTKAIAALRAAGPGGAPCWTIPEQADDLHDLQGLMSIGSYLPPTIWS